MSVRPGLKRPLRNRVTPLGEIVAHPARGMLMGNRGCLHDEAGNIVRPFAAQAWISCLPTWPGVDRSLMAPGHYTELFFLDEATALAAGHRPCGSCRPEALAAFKAAWQRAYSLPRSPKVAAIDAQLRAERKGATPPSSAASEFPDGTMVTSEETGSIWLVAAGRLWRWSLPGYATEPRPSCVLFPVTPPSMIEVLRNGYAPLLALSSQPSVSGGGSKLAVSG